MSTHPQVKIGDVFGDYTVIDNADNRVWYDKHGKRQTKKRMLCRCVCGNVQKVNTSSLLSGNSYRCMKCARKEVAKNQIKDITGQRFGFLTAIEQTEQSSSGRRKWKCRCDCGRETDVAEGRLQSGNTRSCGKCNLLDLQRIENNFKQYIGKKFGMITVVGFGGVFNRKSYADCVCECGRHFRARMNALLTGNTTSCGCQKSKGETEVQKYLDKNNIQFEREVCFPDLKGPGGGFLRFDFMIHDQNGNPIAIEYQGAQHYKETEFSIPHFGEQQRLITDPIKREYCKTHNIRLIEIPFNVSVSKFLDNALRKGSDAA